MISANGTPSCLRPTVRGSNLVILPPPATIQLPRRFRPRYNTEKQGFIQLLICAHNQVCMYQFVAFYSQNASNFSLSPTSAPCCRSRGLIFCQRHKSDTHLSSNLLPLSQQKEVCIRMNTRLIYKNDLKIWTVETGKHGQRRPSAAVNCGIRRLFFLHPSQQFLSPGLRTNMAASLDTAEKYWKEFGGMSDACITVFHLQLDLVSCKAMCFRPHVQYCMPVVTI